MLLHPIVVHFPIALLTVYAVLELIRFPIIKRQPYYFYLKAFLVVAGAAATFVARFTGEMDAERFTPGDPTLAVIERHELFANLTTAVFSLLALAYLVSWLKKAELSPATPGTWKDKVYRSAERFTESPWGAALALLGLISVTVTGALGASIIFGPNADFFVRTIYRAVVR